MECGSFRNVTPRARQIAAEYDHRPAHLHERELFDTPARRQAETLDVEHERRIDIAHAQHQRVELQGRCRLGHGASERAKSTGNADAVRGRKA
jgi:hypothetical protein